MRRVIGTYMGYEHTYDMSTQMRSYAVLFTWCVCVCVCVCVCAKGCRGMSTHIRNEAHI